MSMSRIGLGAEVHEANCRMVGLEEDTCFKKAKEGGRQRGSVCYNHAVRVRVRVRVRGS